MIEAPVSESGVYEIEMSLYQMDQCCAAPSLNASVVDLLIDECPRVAWQSHPRLNPDFEPEYKPHFDIGSAAHLIQLEPELFSDQTVAIDANDWKTDWAQRERNQARRDGKVPLLLRDWKMIRDMNSALMQNEAIAQAFRDGKSERSVFSIDPATGIWRRCRPDKVAYHGGWLLDYKAMESANPREFGQQAWRFKWHRRAAWYLDTFRQATGAEPKDYWFVVQSKKKPYLATINSLDFVDLDKGRRDCERACEIFAECLSRGTDSSAWPGYRTAAAPDRDTAFRSSLPAFAHQAIDAQHQAWSDAKVAAARALANTPLEQ